MARAWCRAALAALALGTALPALADEPVPWYQKIDVNGLLGVSYSINLNDPGSRVNDYRVFDVDDRSFKLDVAELVIRHDPQGPGTAGFRVDATVGASIPRVTASRGLFRDEDGEAEDADIQQAYVSYIAPVGTGLRIDAGKMVTHLGYELIEGYDGYNENATRSFLFGYAVPFTHTGVKASFAFTPRVSGAVLVTNGWDNVEDNNGGLSYGAQLTLAPVDGLSILLNYVGGPEQDENDADDRQVIDLVATWKASEALSVGLNVDYGTEERTVLGDDDATWKGAAVYGRLTLSPAWSLALRGEVFDDPDGWRTGVEQRLTEITLTPQWKAGEHFVLRGDLRVDRSDVPVFDAGQVGTDENGEPVYEQKKTQPTVSVNVIYLF